MAELRGRGDRICSQGGALGLVLGLVACTARPPTPLPTAVVAGTTDASPAEFSRERGSASPPPLTCETTPGHRRVLTLDWTSAEREAIIKGLSRGLAAVRFAGCALTFLPECRVPAGRYVFTPRAPFEYTVTLGPDLPLWSANLPRLASERSARLPDELIFHVSTAGQYRATPIDLRRAAPVGDCDGATHVISTVEVGAIFDDSSRVEIDCHQVHRSDTQPPPLCAMPWSVQLTALDLRAALGQPCPAPLHWNGVYCGRDRELPPHMDCSGLPPSHPACSSGWKEPPPDPQRVLFPERLDRRMIDEGLDTVRAAIAGCGARTGQPAGTRVQLRLRVDGPSGQVVAALALGAEASTPLGHCAVQEVVNARFPTSLAVDQRLNATISTH